MTHSMNPLHSLRHTSASLLIMNGVPVNVVSKRLGHNNSSTTTSIYTHVLRSADELAAEALDNVILSKVKHAWYIKADEIRFRLPFYFQMRNKYQINTTLRFSTEVGSERKINSSAFDKYHKYQIRKPFVK